MSKRRTVLVSFILTIALLAVACGSDANNTARVEGDTAAEATEQTETNTDPTESLVDGPVEDPVPCDREEFDGTWLSARAAGSEPLAEDDGEGNEGGQGVVSLALNDDQTSLRSGDTIELFEEWFCDDSYIYGVKDTGEEWIIGGLVDGGGLEYRGTRLTKADDS